MRAFWRAFRALHIWLLGNAALLAAFFALRRQKAWMTAVSERFSMPLERALGRLCARAPFSLAEWLCVLALLWLAVFLVRSAVLVVRAEYRRETLYRRALTLANVALSVYAALCLLWGVNFYAADFCDKSGVYPAPVATEDLVAVTRYFAAQAAACADAVARDASGAYAVPRERTLDGAPTLYASLYDEFPFLRLADDPRPKPVYFSRALSALNTTGVYFPFTGESNLNMDFPAAMFPFTVAHELAHRRGIASEQQCNFLGVLASVRADDPAYRYSGWLAGYIHLSNALYTADSAAWREIRDALPEAVRADLRAASDYWARYDGAVSRAGERAYDALLKGYGEEMGVRAYSAVVELLVAYFG